MPRGLERAPARAGGHRCSSAGAICSAAAAGVPASAQSIGPYTLRQDVLAVVSHDLRNFLQAIKSGVSLLTRRSGSLDEAINEKIHSRLHTAVDPMNRMIADLMDMANIRAGRISMSTGTENANSLHAVALQIGIADVELHHLHSRTLDMVLYVFSCPVDPGRVRLLGSLCTGYTSRDGASFDHE